MIDHQQLIEINMRLSNIERLIERIVIPDKWLTIKEAAEYGGTSVSSLRRKISKGTLKCSKQTGKLLFKRSAIDRWLNG